MACTVAVEEAIDAHYAGQLETLGEDEAGVAPGRSTGSAPRNLSTWRSGWSMGQRQAPGYRRC